MRFINTPACGRSAVGAQDFCQEQAATTGLLLTVLPNSGKRLSNARSGHPTPKGWLGISRGKWALSGMDHKDLGVHLNEAGTQTETNLVKRSMDSFAY